MALVDLMRLSIRERRTRGFVQCCLAGNPGALCRKTFPRKVRGTADPSATLRSGRDDKGDGDGSIKSGYGTEAFFSSPWVGRRPMIPPVEMTNLSLGNCQFIHWMQDRPWPNKFVISTGAQRSDLRFLFSVLTHPLLAPKSPPSPQQRTGAPHMWDTTNFWRRRLLI